MTGTNTILTLTIHSLNHLLIRSFIPKHTAPSPGQLWRTKGPLHITDPNGRGKGGDFLWVMMPRWRHKVSHQSISLIS